MHRGSEGGTHRTNQLVQPPKPLLKDVEQLKETYSQPKRREKQHHELKHFTTEMSEVILPSCWGTKQHEVQKMLRHTQHGYRKAHIDSKAQIYQERWHWQEFMLMGCPKAEETLRGKGIH